MTVRNLDFLLRPRSLALIGASEREHSIGTAVMHNLLQGGFGGPIYPVHATRASVAGVHAYREVGFLPQTPDLGIICTPPDTVPALVHSLAVKGTRAVAVLTDGVDREAVLAAAKPRLVRLLGPNSMGLLAPAIGLNASFAPTPALPGSLALVSQSGALLAAALDWAAPRGIGFTCAVSLGDAADVDAADVLDFVAGDPATRAVLLYLESLRDGRKFLSAARAASRGKPVIVMKSGRTPAGARAALAHTGAPAGDDAAFEAAVRRAGMLRVHSIAELFDAAETLARMRVPGQSRLAVLTNAGGPAVVAADALAARGGELAGPPIDLGGDATPARYAEALRAALAASPEETLLLLHGPSGVVTPPAVAEACREAAQASGRVLACWLGGERARRGAAALREAGVPVYETPEAAVQAFLHLLDYRRNQESLQEPAPSAAAELPADEAAVQRLLAAALDAGRNRLTDAEGKAILAAYGIRALDAADAVRRRRPGAQAVALHAAADPVFGRVIRLGGAAGIVPLNAALAQRMLPPATPGAAEIARTLAQVSRLLARHPEIVELEIDPLLADEQGVWAYGTRVRVERTRLRPGEHLAIQPYPRELEQPAALGCLSVLLRPVRPEDAAAYADFIARSDPEDLQMRFFRLVRRLPARDLARYTQIDYDREMAFVAAREGEIVGEVRLYMYPGSEAAEFALLVRSDMQRRGLGRALLQKAIDFCRARGQAALLGQIRAENAPMIGLARRLGMEVEVAPGGSLAVAHLALQPRTPEVKLF